MLAELAQHRPIGGRRREADGGAELADGGEQIVGRCPFEQDGRGADAQRKQHQAAEPEREGERRRADEAVGRLRAQHVAAVAVAGRQYVAVEMHGALGLAGGARGEADQADVVARGVAGGEELVAGLRDQRFERVGRAATPIDHAVEISGERTRLLHLVGEPMVAEREPDLGLDDRIGDLLGAQQRHGRHHHAAGLDHRQIGGDHHRAVGAAQQHTMARNHSEIAGERVGDAVHALGQLCVGEGFGRRDQARPIAVAGGNPAVEQLDHAVRAIRILELRQAEQKVRPFGARGQVVACECVEMR